MAEDGSDGLPPLGETQMQPEFQALAWPSAAYLSHFLKCQTTEGRFVFQSNKKLFKRKKYTIKQENSYYTKKKRNINESMKEIK